MTVPPQNAPPDPERDEHAPAEEKLSDTEGDAQAGSGDMPGAGGFEGRDPVTDAPRVPSVPESQDDE